MSFRDEISRQPGNIRHMTVCTAARVLCFLESQGGQVEDKTGKTVKRLIEMTGFLQERHAVNRLLRKLEATGWIALDRGVGHRHTYSIRLARPLTDEIRELARSTIVKEEVEPVRQEEPTVEPDEAKVLGSGPGRLVARIERTIPDIVSAAVEHAIDSRISTMLGALGYVQGGVDPQHKELVNEVELLQKTATDLEKNITDLKDKLHAMSEAYAATRSKLNKALRCSEQGQVSDF